MDRVPVGLPSAGRACFVLCVLVTPVGVACKDKDGDSGEELACDTSASASVNVVVTDTLAEPLTDASVTWSVDGGEPAPCDSFGTQFACGWEVAGTLTITASAPGYLSQTQDVVVEQGQCHVESQNLTLRLEVEGG
jgi:hypothetical protein